MAVKTVCVQCLYIDSGGTEVTVTGSNLDSVAEPRINLTVYTQRISNNTATYNSSVEVMLLTSNRAFVVKVINNTGQYLSEDLGDHLA